MMKRTTVIAVAIAAMLSLVTASFAVTSQDKPLPKRPQVKTAWFCAGHDAMSPSKMTRDAVLVWLWHVEGGKLRTYQGFGLRKYAKGEPARRVNGMAHPSCYTILDDVKPNASRWAKDQPQVCVIVKRHFRAFRVPNQRYRGTDAACPYPRRDRKTGWWTYTIGVTDSM